MSLEGLPTAGRFSALGRSARIEALCCRNAFLLIFCCRAAASNFCLQASFSACLVLAFWRLASSALSNSCILSRASSRRAFSRSAASSTMCNIFASDCAAAVIVDWHLAGVDFLPRAAPFVPLVTLLAARMESNKSRGVFLFLVFEGPATDCIEAAEGVSAVEGSLLRCLFFVTGNDMPQPMSCTDIASAVGAAAYSWCCLASPRVLRLLLLFAANGALCK
mmetsp:Transcript_11877/g.20016  ORF Transcript_11877/g.20016 Transcript_11877/m.20016 type:complete len:221 (+) Transcript_11877:206-868(+)